MNYKLLLIIMSLLMGFVAASALVVIDNSKLVGNTGNVIINYSIVILFINASIFFFLYSILLYVGMLKPWLEPSFDKVDRSRLHLFCLITLSPFIFSTLYFFFVRSIAIGKLIVALALVFLAYDLYGNIKLIKKGD